MPKRLMTQSDRTPVSRLLDPTALREELSRVAIPTGSHDTPNDRSVLASDLEAIDACMLMKRELTLCGRTDRIFAELMERLRRSTRTRLTASHLARAMVSAFEPAIQTLEPVVDRHGPWRLPSNAKQFVGDRQAFEARLVDALKEAIETAKQCEMEKRISSSTAEQEEE